MKLLICHFFHRVVNDVVLMNEAYNCVILNCSFSLMPFAPVLRGSECQDPLFSAVPLAFLLPAARWSETGFVINAKAVAVQFISLTLFCCAHYFSRVLLVRLGHFFALAALLWDAQSVSAAKFSKGSPPGSYSCCHSDIPPRRFFSVYISETIQQSGSPKVFGG